MIAQIEGELVDVLADGSILIRNGMITFSVLVPAYDLNRFTGLRGQGIELHTLFYIESVGQGNVLLPRLIGFESPQARAFFDLFTTVKGIGNRKALKALAAPIGTIALAIADRDAAFLTTLPEIGKRTAETIVAELHGKVDRFISQTKGDADRLSRTQKDISDSPRHMLIEDTLAVLSRLGETQSQARQWIEQVLKDDPALEDIESVIAAVYRSKSR